MEYDFQEHNIQKSMADLKDPAIQVMSVCIAADYEVNLVMHVNNVKCICKITISRRTKYALLGEFFNLIFEF